MAENLPDDCWMLIFDRLPYRSHQSPSLTCKRFLSLTNACRTHLTIVNRFPNSTPINRFPNLVSIRIRHSLVDINPIITCIATKYNLNLKAFEISRAFRAPLEGFKILGSRMKDLRVLNCSRFFTLLDIDLIAIANSMPCLEDLTISSLSYATGQEVGVTDSGIEVLSSKLKGLRKIDISGNKFLTVNSLFALSKNCVYLTDITAYNCRLLTPKGIRSVLHKSANLRSLSFGKL